ncbi:hypothetical protein NUKP76_43950 [Klebsiella variicola]|nr:hypothetical protein NUKP76_43950 [Klebsiella variicola]
MMSLWDALRMNMMISYQELVRTFPKFNPDLLKYTEIKGQLGISKEMLPGKLPGNMGNIGASVISEGGGKGAEQVIKKIEDKNEK